MTPNTTNQFIPDYAVAPGETLKESMDVSGVNQTELALRTGLSRKTINGIIAGREPLTPGTALLLEKVFRVPARFWNNLQKNYDEALARLREREILREYESWPEEQEFPVGELIKRGLLPRVSDRVERVAALLRFFGVATPAEYSAVWREIQEAYAFRKSAKVRSGFGAISAWLRLGELEAQSIVCEPFDRDKLKAALPALRALIPREAADFQDEIKRLGAACGVAVVYVPGLKGAPIHGATRFLTPHKAILQLSLRGKDDANFWFSLFHEIGHLLLHGKKEVFLELDKPGETEREREADEYARFLIVPDFTRSVA